MLGHSFNLSPKIKSKETPAFNVFQLLLVYPHHNKFQHVLANIFNLLWGMTLENFFSRHVHELPPEPYRQNG
jgi:hypothetical protein